jgi:hypothetical protein
MPIRYSRRQVVAACVALGFQVIGATVTAIWLARGIALAVGFR